MRRGVAGEGLVLRGKFAACGSLSLEGVERFKASFKRLRDC